MSSEEKLRFGSYEVLQHEDGSNIVLGNGGFGRIYKAKHAILGRVAALKVIKEDLLQSGTETEKEKIIDFKAEARAVAMLNHPSIAHIHDCASENGVYYQASEFCEGGTLQQYCETHGPLTWEQARPMIIKILEGLEYAHSHGIIHRDIKPANIMLANLGSLAEPKIIDFGLARTLGDEPDDSSATIRGTSLDGWGHTPATASPEQLKGSADELPDGRSDLFSLGVTIWWVLIGKNPFADMKIGQIYVDRLGPNSYAGRLPNNLPPEGKRILASLLEKQRDQRPATATEALAMFDSQAPIPAEPPLAVEPAPPFSAPLVSSSADSNAPCSHFEPADFDDAWQLGPKLFSFTGCKIYEVTALNDGQRALVINAEPDINDRLLAGLRLAAARRLDFGTFRFLDWRLNGRDDALIVSRPLHFPLLSVLRKAGPLRFRDALPMFALLARSFDTAYEWLGCGVQVDPAHVHLSHVSGTTEPSAVESWSDINLLSVMGLPLFESNAESGVSSEATISASTEGIPALARFAALIYRVVSGSAVSPAAYYTESGYVMASGFSEDGNALIASTLSNPDPEPRVCDFLQMLASLESQPLPDVSPLFSGPSPELISAEIRNLEAIHLQRELLERERLERQRLEMERLVREKLERERLERERLERERLERERLERERLERESLERERLERERLERERLERERLEQERLEQERLEKERLERERLERETLEKERLERERTELKRIERERLVRERLEQERLEREQLERQRLEDERLTRERLEKERSENERLERELLEQQRLEAERLANERRELERLLAERLELEKQQQLQAEQTKLPPLTESPSKAKAKVEPQSSAPSAQNKSGKGNRQPPSAAHATGKPGNQSSSTAGQQVTSPVAEGDACTQELPHPQKQRENQHEVTPKKPEKGASRAKMHLTIAAGVILLVAGGALMMWSGSAGAEKMPPKPPQSEEVSVNPLPKPPATSSSEPAAPVVSPVPEPAKKAIVKFFMQQSATTNKAFVCDSFAVTPISYGVQSPSPSSGARQLQIEDLTGADYKITIFATVGGTPNTPVATARVRLPANPLDHPLDLQIPSALPTIEITNPFDNADYTSVSLQAVEQTSSPAQPIDLGQFSEKPEAKIELKHFVPEPGLRKQPEQNYPSKDRSVVFPVLGGGEWQITYTGSRFPDRIEKTSLTSHTAGAQKQAPKPLSGKYSVVVPMTKFPNRADGNTKLANTSQPPNRVAESDLYKVEYHHQFVYALKVDAEQWQKSRNDLVDWLNNDHAVLPHYLGCVLELDFRASNQPGSNKGYILLVYPVPMVVHLSCSIRNLRVEQDGKMELELASDLFFAGGLNSEVNPWVNGFIACVNNRSDYEHYVKKTVQEWCDFFVAPVAGRSAIRNELKILTWPLKATPPDSNPFHVSLRKVEESLEIQEVSEVFDPQKLYIPWDQAPPGAKIASVFFDVSKTPAGTTSRMTYRPR